MNKVLVLGGSGLVGKTIISEIKKEVHFTEQFFQTEYYCLYT